VLSLRIVAEYSHKGGSEYIRKHFPKELVEIIHVIATIDALKCKVKVSKEKTMPGQMLYSPMTMNKEFKEAFWKKGWNNYRVHCDYSDKYYVQGYQKPNIRGGFREMDFIKNRLGVEVQFGKYAFMTYDVCAKMVIFKKRGLIDAGIEIVPSKKLADDMSTGVSTMEQLIWDLENRSEADIDIPVLVLGVEDDHLQDSNQPKLNV